VPLVPLLRLKLDGEGVVIWTCEVVREPALGLVDVFFGDETAVRRGQLERNRGRRDVAIHIAVTYQYLATSGLDLMAKTSCASSWRTRRRKSRGVCKPSGCSLCSSNMASNV